MSTENLEFNKKKYIVDYLDLVPPPLLKQYTIILLMFPDLILLLFLFIDPFVPLFAYTLLPPIISLNLWAIWIFFTPYKSQLNYFLYIGVMGIFLSIGFLISANKFVYFSMGIQSLYYPIISIFLYIFVFVIMVKLHFKALRTGFYMRSKTRRSKVNQQAAIVCFFTVIGIIGGHILISKAANYNQILGVLSGICILFSLIFMVIILNVHKYILIRKYPELIKDKIYIKKGRQ